MPERKRCECHGNELTQEQEYTLDILAAWVEAHGTKNLSHRLTHGSSVESRIYNQCSTHFKRRFNLGKLSALAIACHVAGIEYTPGMLRSTTQADDLQELLSLYDAGEMLTERAMSAHSRLRHRLKRRFGDTWFSVFAAARWLRPEIEFRRFFGNAPEGVYVDPEGRIVECKDQGQIVEFATKVFRDYCVKFPASNSIAQILGEGPAEIRRLYTRLLDQKLVAREIVEHATGRSFPQFSMSHNHLVPMHGIIGKEHPALGSYSELVVDTAFSRVVNEYEARHDHQVSLSKIVGESNWEGSPFTGSRGPVVDMLVDKKLVVEISFATERRNPTYAKKIAWKLARLSAAGVPAVNVRIEDGAKVNSEKICIGLSSIGVIASEEKVREVLWAAAFEHGTKDIAQALR